MVADIRRMGRAAAFFAAVWTAAAQTESLPHGWLWRDPGDVAALDFGGTVGAPVHLPKPLFAFVREDPRGTQPKVFVRDAEGATWNVRFGYEVHPESFCWRLVRACGYFAEPNFYVASGKLEGYKPIQRANPSLTQLRAGLKSSGASDGDAECFAKALRARIEELRKIR